MEHNQRLRVAAVVAALEKLKHISTTAGIGDKIQREIFEVAGVLILGDEVMDAMLQMTELAQQKVDDAYQTRQIK